MAPRRITERRMEIPTVAGRNIEMLIPQPLLEEDWDLMMQTLTLWRKNLVKQPRKERIARIMAIGSN